jgi:formylglycine-generating enzyme required for sulfatase activity
MNGMQLQLNHKPLNWVRHHVGALVLLLLAMGVCMNSSAQNQRALGVVQLNVPGSAPQNLYEQSYALVIGASNYRNGWSRLPGVLSDVKEVEAVLGKQGFAVTRVIDPNRDQLDAALRSFVGKYGQNVGNRLLVYFAGHGHTLTTHAGGRLGYIVPVDAPRPDVDLGGFKAAAYSMDSIEGLAKQMDARHALFMFDSCFSGTIFRTRSGVPDNISDKTSKPVRQFITAGDENQPVPDQSIFRRQLVAALGEDAEADLNGDGYITGSELGMFLEDKVTNYSRRTQTPRHGKIQNPDLDKGDFVFQSLKPKPAPPATQVASLKPEPVNPTARPGQASGLSLDDLEKEESTRKEWSAWQARMKADYDKTAAFGGSADLRAKAWERFLAAWGQDNPLSREDEALRAQARQRQEGAQGEARQQAAVQQIQSPATQTVTVTGSRRADQVFKDCADCPEMVVIPAGLFQMGSNEGANEKPVHSVTLKSFALGKYEVTQGQWKAVMGNNPSGFSSCGDTCPVEQVSWDDIQYYIHKLNTKSGKSYRLPSEAEWEYAARAGTTTQYWWGDKASHEYANFGKDDCPPCGGLAQGRDKWENIAPVGQFAANAFGLHDMHGNVWEWVQDYYHESYSGAPVDGSAWESGGEQKYQVLRGGSWSGYPAFLRSAYRYWLTPGNRNSSIGFRLARTAP